MTLTTYYPAPSGVYARLLTTETTVLARNGASVGIGVATPTATLDVNGTVRIRGGSPAAGFVLTTDAAGAASWQVPTAVYAP